MWRFSSKETTGEHIGRFLYDNTAPKLPAIAILVGAFGMYTLLSAGVSTIISDHIKRNLIHSGWNDASRAALLRGEGAPARVILGDGKACVMVSGTAPECFPR